jgi:hypothetical protein
VPRVSRRDPIMNYARTTRRQGERETKRAGPSVSLKGAGRGAVDDYDESASRSKLHDRNTSSSIFWKDLTASCSCDSRSRRPEQISVAIHVCRHGSSPRISRMLASYWPPDSSDFGVFLACPGFAEDSKQYERDICNFRSRHNHVPGLRELLKFQPRGDFRIGFFSDRTQHRSAMLISPEPSLRIPSCSLYAFCAFRR